MNGSRIQQLYDEALAVGLELIQAEARRILLEHKTLSEFVMCHGSAFFVDNTGNTINLDERKYMSGLNEFMCEWNGVYKFSGESMRFTATGPTYKDWGVYYVSGLYVPFSG
jgi:hypothetical protein